MIKNGALGVGESIWDFEIGNTEGLPPLDLQDNIRYEYNQGSSLDCTLYSSFGALSDLMNYRFSKSEIQEIVNMSYDRGRIKGKGWHTSFGVKCVCDYWNEKNPSNPVVFYKLKLTSDTIIEALSKNYTIIVTYRGNANYNNDYRSDLSLDNDSFGTPTYGHATTIITKDIIVKDSYAGAKNSKGQDINHYVIKAKLENLVKNRVYYPTAYIIVKLNNIDRLEELKRLKNFEILVKNNIETNSEMRHYTNDEEFKKFLHETNNRLRDKLNDIQKEFDKFS